MSCNYEKYACSIWPVCGDKRLRENIEKWPRPMTIRIEWNGQISLSMPHTKDENLVLTMTRNDARLLARRIIQALEAK